MAKKGKPRPQSRPHQQELGSDSQPLTGLHETAWGIAAIALFMSRFFLPAEGVDQGQTLWIAASWFGLAAVRFWWNWRNQVPSLLSLQGIDVALLLLVSGHLISALTILMTQGDQRASLNLIWEWLSLIPMWMLIKDLIHHDKGRRSFTACLLTLSLLLAGLGIWQHYVWYPLQSAEISELLALDARSQSGESLTPTEATRYQQLKQTMGSELLTLNASARESFLNRVQASVEPIGFFALANSFAAILLVGFLTALFMGLAGLQTESPRWQTIAKWSVIAVIGYCLLLTKSRTAWIGGMTGVSCYLLLIIRSTSFGKLAFRGVIAVISCIFAAILIAWFAGGLDREVLTEAPKSLEYRLEYWIATSEMIRQSPIIGVGPGNFRQHYLAHKLPGASEEILDPHNFVLDVWANGGLIALAGMLLLLFFWAKNAWKIRSFSISDVQAEGMTGIPSQHSSQRKTIANSDSTSLLLVTLKSGVLSLILVLGVLLIFDGYLETRLLTFLVAWPFAAILIAKCFAPINLTAGMSTAAGIALLVHLSGAGGIGMPAVSQLLLSLILLSSPLAIQQLNTHNSQNSPAAVFAVSSALCFGLCLWSAVVPVWKSSAFTQQGVSELMTGHLQAARVSFEKAAAADSLSASPHQHLANISIAQWQSSGRRDDEQFQSALQYQQQAIERDPSSAKRLMELGIWWLEKAKAHQDKEAAEQAVQVLKQAADYYPNYAPLRAQLALALKESGESGHEEAQRALELNQLNEMKGHTDKLLTNDLKKQIERLISIPSSNVAEPTPQN